VDKYSDSLPWDRQVKRFARDGLQVTVAALWDQCEALANWLMPLMPKLRAYLLTLAVLGADETWWRLMDKRRNGGTNKKWWKWALRADCVSSNEFGHCLLFSKRRFFQVS
jgi:hypothetical protein